MPVCCVRPMLAMLLALGIHHLAWAQSAPTAAPATDDAAVNDFLRSYTAAFATGDASNLAEFWAEDAEWESTVTGEQASGREQIVADFQAFFDETPGARLSGSIDSYKQVAPGVVCLDGQTELTIGGDPPTYGTFHAVLTSTGGKWQLAKVIESAPPALETTATKLEPLSFLVGQWQDEGEGPTVNTSVRWGTGQTFLIRAFTIDGEDQSAQGTQVIGWDPRENRLRSWSFYSDGSFGGGTWSHSGSEWIGRLSQTLPDGTTCSGTQVIRTIDNDTLEVENVGRDIDGEPLPSLPPVRMVRVESTDETADTSNEAATGAAVSEEE